jgi:preprotein translocase subunit YajC
VIGASGGGGFFLLLIVAFVALYFIMVRPQKRRQLQQQRMLNDAGVGSQILTAGGIYGEITAVGDDEVTVRIAPDTEVRIARRAIAGVITPETDETELEAPEEPETSGPTPGT